MPPAPDLIAAGELLVDLISTEYAEDFRSATSYHRIPGGSPANLAGNLVRLGKSAALVAAVGQDDAGTYLREYTAELGLDVSRVRTREEPTTLVLVTKSKTVSRFVAYRGADAHLELTPTDHEWLMGAKIFHTTAFALSRLPARQQILRARDFLTNEVANSPKAAPIRQSLPRLSIDANYAPEIWPDRREAQAVISHYLQGGTLAKFSEVDYHRLFGEPVTDPRAAGQRILDLGAGLCCLTMGAGGVHVFTPTQAFHLPARPVAVRDTTGAGDAFWAGFLAGWIDGETAPDCARRGRALAEQKLQVLGPLPRRVNLEL